MPALIGLVGANAPVSEGLPAPLRLSRDRSLVTLDGHARFQEAVARGNCYALTLNAWTTGIAAGNLVSAAAAASTNFALWNPPGSGKNLVLWKFFMGLISGTPAAGPLFHGRLPGGVPKTTPNVAGTAALGGAPVNLLLGSPNTSAAGYIVSAAGAAVTGGAAPVIIRPADFTSTATAQASPGMVKALEFLEGEITIGSGEGWLPLWASAGTTVLGGYGVVWEEVPIIQLG